MKNLQFQYRIILIDYMPAGNSYIFPLNCYCFFFFWILGFWPSPPPVIYFKSLRHACALRTRLLQCLLGHDDLALQPSEDLQRRFFRAVGRCQLPIVIQIMFFSQKIYISTYNLYKCQSLSILLIYIYVYFNLYWYIYIYVPIGRQFHTHSCSWLNLSSAFDTRSPMAIHLPN